MVIYLATMDVNPRRVLMIKPNQAAVQAARRGLDARRAASPSKRGGLDAMQAAEQGIGSGVLRARDIVAGKRINAYQVKAFFDRHQKNYLNAKMKGLKPEESRAIQAWLLWGGEPLRKQVESAVARDKKRRGNPGQPLSRVQLKKGAIHELEHTDDIREALKIAQDHLEEIPDYYDRLERLEEEAKAEGAYRTKNPYDLQTVIVSKDVADSRDEAKGIAKDYAKRMYTSRETGQSYRFRQRPPEDFVPSSFRTKKIPDQGVSLVYGKLKENPIHTINDKPMDCPSDLGWRTKFERDGILPNPGDMARLGDALELRWAESDDDRIIVRQWEPSRGKPFMFLWSPRLWGVICLREQGVRKAKRGEEPDAKAVDIFERFMARRPRKNYYVELTGIPMVQLGSAIHIVYRSDKWTDDGRETDYIHDYDRGVRCYADNHEDPNIFLMYGGRLTITERGLIY